MSLNLGLQPTTRQLLDGWGLLAAAAIAIAVMPALQVSTAYTPEMQLSSDAAAFRSAMFVHFIFGLTILLPSLVAALWVYASALVAEGRVDNPNLERYGLGASIIGGAVVLTGILLYGSRALCLTNPLVVLDKPIFHLGYALFAIGVLATLISFLLAVARRISKRDDRVTRRGNLQYGSV